MPPELPNLTPIINRLLADNFADLAGAELHTTLPVGEGLINDLLATVLQAGLPASEPTPTADPPPKIEPDLPALLKHIQQATLRFEDGRAIADITLRVADKPTTPK